MSVGKSFDAVAVFCFLEELESEKNRGQGVRTNVRNSSRVLGSSRNPPSMAEVTVFALIFWTPRMTIHMCLNRVNNKKKKEIIILL